MVASVGAWTGVSVGVAVIAGVELYFFLHTG